MPPESYQKLMHTGQTSIEVLHAGTKDITIYDFDLLNFSIFILLLISWLIRIEELHKIDFTISITFQDTPVLETLGNVVFTSLITILSELRFYILS